MLWFYDSLFYYMLLYMKPKLPKIHSYKTMKRFSGTRTVPIFNTKIDILHFVLKINRQMNDNRSK